MSNDTKSYKEHNSQYESISIDSFRESNKQKFIDNEQFNKDQPLGQLLIDNEQFNKDQPLGQLLIDFEGKIKYGIDIGSGAGWVSNLLSAKMHKVYALEPSLAAQNIAKTIYSDLTNVEYICGFAEETLEQLEQYNINEPMLFTTSTVLSHLSDDTVSAICKKIHKLSVEGSVFSFSENWSEYGSVQEELWYSRNKDWWRLQFPNWDITFNTTYPSNRPGMYKGFWGVKHKSFDAMKDEDFWNETC